ncbi:toprim domain-containing protein [Methylocaldum sp. 14B]|uniref:toprim domain-containing protein n=1 Tax=Methylocaldum sp. 14B TaxID=1912213 RepID=UPI00098B6C4A|nr:toprim domain-containing protein [Methylocaldum sp. 14B]
MDVISNFKSAMQAAGIVPPTEIIGDGRLHRFHIEGQRHGTLNGAYVLHLDRHPAGWFQDFKTGVSGTWKAGGGTWRMDEATRKHIEEERRRRQAEIETRHRKKAAEARVLWGKASPCMDHPYLNRKGVQAHGVRAGNWPKWIEGPDSWRRILVSGALLVPMRDEHGELWNLQAIFPSVHADLGRDKDFLGGRKGGLFHIVGKPTDTLLIAEGYATGATVHETTGYRTFIAFDAGNLKTVAVTVRKVHPCARIVLCADNDRFTDKPIRNPGLTKAREAALAIGGCVACPQFPEGAKGTDWNDWLMEARHG